MIYILQIDHNADLANAYCQAFREKLVFRNFQTTFAAHHLIKAVNSNAERNYVDNVLNTSVVNYISAAGHGEYGCLLGEDGLPLWEANPISQPSFQPLSGKIIHLLSCDSASYLGHMMINFGVACFWGYTSEFSWPRQPRLPLRSIENDSIAEPFFEMDAIIDKGILSGNSAQTKYQDVSTYVRNTVATLPSRHRPMFLDNYMIMACPVLNWGNPLTALSVTD